MTAANPSQTRSARPVTARHRLMVASRALAAIGGGYALAAAAAVLLQRTLPMPPRDAVLAAGMVAFIVFTVAVMWAFTARTALAAWLGVGVPALALAAVVLLLRWWGTA